MPDYPESLDKMLAIWNAKSAAEIEELVKEALESNVHFVDPNYNIIGHERFIEMVHAVRNEIPGAVYSRASAVDSHHNHYRYHWAIHMADNLLVSGFDVTETNDAGKVVKIIGFFGELGRH